MKVIGVTGGIGSGKSMVAQFLAELGAVIIDADKVGHEAFKPDTEVWHKVVAAFGEQILASDGTIDRSKLGKIVFSHPGSLSQLNQITHPRIGKMMRAQLENYQRQGVRVVVLEIPLLVDTGKTSLVDEVWVTVASESTVLKRLEERSGLSRQQSLARIHSQISNEERIKHTDVVINNDGSLDELKVKVSELWQRLLVHGTGKTKI